MFVLIQKKYIGWIYQVGKYDEFTLLPGKEYNASWDKKKRKWILYVY